MNQFPDGVASDDDEGQIRTAISSENGVVKVSFEKPCSWVGLTPDGAREFASMIMNHADRAEKQRKQGINPKGH